MADPWASVPYHDPHDDTATEHLLQLLHIENPTLADIYPADHQRISSSNEIGDPWHPIHDPVVWSMVGQTSASVGTGFSGRPCGSAPDPTVVGNYGLDNGKSLTVWSEPPAPYSCLYCQVLREIIHTDGNNSTKLELHGRVGIISHAILESHGMHIGQRYEMFDFCKKNVEDVKEFLKQYFKERQQAGYIVMSDPLSNFYGAICIGLVTDGYGDGADSFFEPSIASSESGNEEPLTPTPDPPEADSGGNKGKSPNPNKSSLSIQRARLGRMRLLDLAAYFHLPIEEAARRLEICPTVIKRICRRDGLNRWPHRKIKSIDCKVSKLKQSYARALSVEERQRYLGEIQKHQRRIDDICYGVARAT